MNKTLLYIIICFILSGCSVVNLYAGPDVTKNEYVYSKHGNTADLYVPEGTGPFPAVVLIHGGSWASGTRNHMAWIARKLVESGFAAFNISYRLAPKNHYPDQFSDCKEAVFWLRKNAAAHKIDPDRIGVFGFSAGGQLAGLVATNPPDDLYRVQAAVLGSGPHDFLLAKDHKAIEKFLGTNYKDHPELYTEASPLYHVTSDDPPMFIYHGSRDKIVWIKHSLEMHEALDKAGVENELYLIEGYGHINLFVFASTPVRKSIEFLKKHLAVR